MQQSSAQRQFRRYLGVPEHFDIPQILLRIPNLNIQWVLNNKWCYLHVGFSNLQLPLTFQYQMAALCYGCAIPLWIYILLIVTNQLLAVFYQKLSSIVFRSLCITIRSLCVIIRSLIQFSIFSRSNRCKWSQRFEGWQVVNLLNCNKLLLPTYCYTTWLSPPTYLITTQLSKLIVYKSCDQANS